MDDIFFMLTPYYESIRTALFISSFTLGSFLFTMKAVIIKTMREDVYDQEDYQEEVRQHRKLGKKTGFYSPLKNFANLLLGTICACFISAILQITLGFIPSNIALTICLLAVLITWILVGASIYYVSINWTNALVMAEDKAVMAEKKLNDLAQKDTGRTKSE